MHEKVLVWFGFVKKGWNYSGEPILLSIYFYFTCSLNSWISDGMELNTEKQAVHVF